MTETIFTFLNSVGFTHPLHPVLTHIPMGMVIGAVVFRMVSFLPRMKHVAKTGYHCVILGLMGIPPTVFAGYLDWQHTHGGHWKFLIILKIILAGVLTITLAAIAFMDDPQDIRFNRITLLYILIVILAAGLGFSGRELQYG